MCDLLIIDDKLLFKKNHVLKDATPIWDKINEWSQ